MHNKKTIQIIILITLFRRCTFEQRELREVKKFVMYMYNTHCLFVNIKTACLAGWIIKIDY